MTFHNQILERKLNFVFHLANLSEDTLANTIWKEQTKDMETPSLWNETREHLQKMGLTLQDIQNMSKWQFKKRTKGYVRNKNFGELFEEAKRYKKMNIEELSQQNFVRKEYFSNQNLETSRILFRLFSKLIPTIKANWPSKYRRQGIPITCPSCTPTRLSSSLSSSSTDTRNNEESSPTLHSQTHILSDCLLVSGLRDECNQSNDKSLAEFLKRVIARHMDLNVDQITNY